MKKAIRKIGIAALTLILVACGNVNSNVDVAIQNQIQNANEIKENEINNSEIENNEAIQDVSETLSLDNTDIQELAEADGLTGDTVDVDLTILSSTMVYSEVYNMMYTPESYIGKKVKMRGMFVVYSNPEETQFYPAVIIADATACCTQGLEFVLEGNPAYPEGYPEAETEITVTGTFETYDEEGMLYCRLQNAVIG